MEFGKNKRSKRQSFTISPFSSDTQLQPTQMGPPAWREEMRRRDRDEEERMDKFYTLLGRIKAMKGLWRQGGENKRVKPVLEPVWQPTFSIEDFLGVEVDVREREHKGKEKEKERREMEKPEKREEQEKGKEIQKDYQKRSNEMEWHEIEDNVLDLNLSL